MPKTHARKISADAPRPRPRQRAEQQRAIDTKRKIIEAAKLEFARHGFEGASTRNVAAEAGIQHTLVTYHYGSKEGLWRETLGHMLGEYSENFRRRIEGLRGVDDCEFAKRAARLAGRQIPARDIRGL